MVIDKKNPKHIIADEGKVLKRVVGHPLQGKEVILNKVKIDGVMEDDMVENYIEVDEPKEKEEK